jgi:hypothetical protein
VMMSMLGCCKLITQFCWTFFLISYFRILLGSGSGLGFGISAHRSKRRTLVRLNSAQAQFFVGLFHPFSDAASSSRRGRSWVRFSFITNANAPLS